MTGGDLDSILNAANAKLDAALDRTADTTAGLHAIVAAAIRKEPAGLHLHGGGTVTYRVYLDGRWVGWVGDGRAWKGHTFGGRKWWGCWREEGDTASRACTELEHASRKSALAWLTETAR